MILGGLEGALLGVVATLFVVSLAPRTRETILTSPTGTAVNHLMTALGPILPGEIRDVLSPFDHPSDPIAATVERVEARPSSRTGRAPAEDPEPATLEDFYEEGRSRIGRAVLDTAEQELRRARTRGTGRPGPPTRSSSPRRSTICTKKAGRASVARSSTRPSRNSNEHVGRMTERLSVGDRAINLTQVLKLAGWALHGGEAKALIRRASSSSTGPSSFASGGRWPSATPSPCSRRGPFLDPRRRPSPAGGPRMKRIGILTAGGDTPALNATIAGAVHRANQLRVEVFGIIKGFSGLLNPAGPPRPPQPALPLDPRARRRRGAGRSWARRATTSTPTTPRRSPGWPIAWAGSRSTGSSASAATARSTACRR